MTVAIWDDSYRTGNKIVDAQHQELFRMVNELHDAIVAGKGREVMSPTLVKLANYTVEHFQEEERLMHEVNYPGLEGHQGKHKDLTDKVIALIGKYQTGEAVLAITLSRFLANWLTDHIKKEDIALIRYVQAHRGALADSSAVLTAAR